MSSDSQTERSGTRRRNAPASVGVNDEVAGPSSSGSGSRPAAASAYPSPADTSPTVSPPVASNFTPDKAKYPGVPFHPGHPLTSKRLRFLAWHLVALDLVPLAKLGERGHKILFTALLCPLMLVTMHTTSAYTFTPKYRRFLDLITYPAGSTTYHRIRYCSDLHSPLKSCVESQGEEWTKTVSRIANLYIRFYIVRAAASAIFRLLAKKRGSSAGSAPAAPRDMAQTAQAVANNVKQNILVPFARSTLYLSLHMSLHRFLMCNVVEKPLDRHRWAYYTIAAIASSMCWIESGSRMGVINRMLAVYLVTELGIWAEQLIWTGGTNWRGNGLLGSVEEAEAIRTGTPSPRPAEEENKRYRTLTPSHGSVEPLLINTPEAQLPRQPLWAIGRPDSSLLVAGIYVAVAISIHVFSVTRRHRDILVAQQQGLAAEAAFGSISGRGFQTPGLKAKVAATVVGRKPAAIAAGTYPDFKQLFADTFESIMETSDGFRIGIREYPWGSIARTVLAGLGMAAVSSVMM